MQGGKSPVLLEKMLQKKQMIVLDEVRPASIGSGGRVKGQHRAHLHRPGCWFQLDHVSSPASPPKVLIKTLKPDLVLFSSEVLDSVSNVSDIGELHVGRTDLNSA